MSNKNTLDEILQKVRNNALPESQKTGLEPWDEMTDEEAKATIQAYIRDEIIGEDEEVESMEDYVEYRGGTENIEDDDNPEIVGNARNELRAEQRSRLASGDKGQEGILFRGTSKVVQTHPGEPDQVLYDPSASGDKQG